MMRVLELYSGIGGIHFALERAGLSYEVVAAIDINPICNNVYKANFPNTPQISKCLTSLDVEDFDNFEADMVVMSPPCQPFTILGNQKDIGDERTKSFQHFTSLLPKMKTLPKHILLENVGGMENSQMRMEFVKILKYLNYEIQEFMLCPSQFRIPNSRKRYYLLAKLHPLEFSFPKKSGIITDINEINLNGKLNHLLAGLHSNKTYLKHFIENENYVDQLLVQEKNFKKFWIMDLVSEDSSTCCCFTKGYGRHIERAGSILQMQQSTNDLWKYQNHEDCSEFIEEIRKLKLRFFSPREIANLMCFPKTLVFPKGMSNQQCFRVLGNSINVHVVSCLLNILIS